MLYRRSNPMDHFTGDEAERLSQLQDELAGVLVGIARAAAHAYPKLKAYPHPKGHIGTEGHPQYKELAGIPAPVLFTTCSPPADIGSAGNRFFTTGPAAYPEIPHIDEQKDFTNIIEIALKLGGYETGIPLLGSDGSVMTSGFVELTASLVEQKR